MSTVIYLGLSIIFKDRLMLHDVFLNIEAITEKGISLGFFNA